VREQIGAPFVTQSRIQLGEERRGLHQVGLLADELDHFRQEVAIGAHVEGRVVQTHQVAIFRAAAEVRVGGLKSVRRGAVLTGVDQGLDGPYFRAEFDPCHVSLRTIMPFSAENRHLGEAVVAGAAVLR
jgi:hypothetical protein